MLGKGSFGKVVLVKGKLLGGPEKLYTIKVLKNRALLPPAFLRSLLRRKPW
jgi:hypothetical protein